VHWYPITTRERGSKHLTLEQQGVLPLSELSDEIDQLWSRRELVKPVRLLCGDAQVPD
jgi:hypothetical protein